MQLPDRLSRRRFLYRAARGNPDTTDAADAIYRNGGSRSLLSMAKSGSGYVGSIVMGVHTG